MPSLQALLDKIATALGLTLDPAGYSAFLSKKLTLSSSLAVHREGHGYHIEVTNPNAEMLVFPVVTSSKYDTTAENRAEKSRYVLKIDVDLHRKNLIALIERCISNPMAADLEKDPAYYQAELARVSAITDPVIRTFTQLTHQIRGSGQRQLEIGHSSDGRDFITLRNCLLPNDYLIFLQREAAVYDVLGMPREAAEDADLSGWQAASPGRKIVPADNIIAGPSEEHGPATESKIEEVIAACEKNGSNSIIALAGVPGTGKSFIAAIAAERLAGDASRVREIQFHPSFAYEEFVEGLRVEEGGIFKPFPGVFSEINNKALENPQHRFVLLIEELTRANVGSVLGELMTYAEHRERKFIGMYSRKSIQVAKNLIILGTYNPIDRSALDMDSALIRRLRIVTFPPSKTQLREMLEANGLATPTIEQLEKLFAVCETKADYETWMPFGHGIFAGVHTEQPDLYDLWHERIKYLLFRPGLSPHKFANTIAAEYPWKDKNFGGSSAASQASPTATPATGGQGGAGAVADTSETAPPSGVQIGNAGASGAAATDSAHTPAAQT